MIVCDCYLYFYLYLDWNNAGLSTITVITAIHSIKSQLNRYNMYIFRSWDMDVSFGWYVHIITIRKFVLTQSYMRGGYILGWGPIVCVWGGGGVWGLAAVYCRAMTFFRQPYCIQAFNLGVHCQRLAQRPSLWMDVVVRRWVVNCVRKAGQICTQKAPLWLQR